MEFATWQYGMLVVAFLMSLVLTRVLYKTAHKRGWLAVPNTRSSHKVPTPSGAGAVIAIVFLVVTVVLGLLKVIPSDLTLALVVGGIAIAVIGWIDERKTLSARVRLPVHILAAIFAVIMFRGMPFLYVGVSIELGAILGGVIAVIGIVWMSNLYNFMDGIDGLIGSQAVFVTAVAGTYIAVLVGALPIALLTWVLGASIAGFLVWNWHPARIFMGDVGSVLIGYILGVLALWTENAHALPLFVWAILLAPFIVDASATTLKRLLQGERWYEAHRAFSYQRACNRWTHSGVVLRVLGLEVLLSPIVFIAAVRPPFAFLLFLVVTVFWIIVWHFVQTSLIFSQAHENRHA